MPTKKDRVNVIMPPDLLEEIKKRTQESQRSMSKEVVWIVQQFLKQELAREQKV